MSLLAACEGADDDSSQRRIADATVPDTVEVSGELPDFSKSGDGSQAALDAAADVNVASLGEQSRPAAPDGPAVIERVALDVAPIGPAAVSAPIGAGAGPGTARAEPVLRSATFAFSGDTLPHSPLVRRAGQYAGGDGYDFSPMFARVAPVLSAADYAVCHLETPIAPPGTPLTTYPTYGVPAAVTSGLASAGYDRCSTASNHTIDRGVAGIDATVDALQAAGLTQAGMARTPDEAVTAVIDVNGIAVAHLSFTMNLNGGRLPPDQPWRSNIIDPAAIIAAARDTRTRGAEVVIVSLHWGTEGVAAPNPFQLDIADQVTRSGEVDLIVGHHAHVIQPIQQVNERWVVFGMGNFLSNMPTGNSWPASSQDGMIVTVAIAEQADGRFLVEKPSVVPTWVDRANSFVIRPVLSDLLDPAVPDPVKAQLAASLERTRSVVGEFLMPSG